MQNGYMQKQKESRKNEKSVYIVHNNLSGDVVVFLWNP